jgi:superkiller protein 3
MWRSAWYHDSRVANDLGTAAEDHFTVGTRYLELHAPRFAIGHLVAATQRDSTRAKYWCNLAWAELLMGRWDYAKFAAEQAVARDPQDARAWCNLGDAVWKLGAVDQAVAAFENAVKADRGRVTAAKNRLKLALAEKRRHKWKGVDSAR